MSFGFGALPQQPVNIADLVRLFDPAALGQAQGFSGTSGTIEEPLQVRVPMGGRPAPAPVASMFEPQPVQPPAPQSIPPEPPQAGGPVAADFTPPPPPQQPVPRPAGFGFGPISAPQAALQAEPEATGSTAPSAPSGGGFSSFLNALSKPSVYNTLIGIGTGLMSTPGLGQGFAAGIGNASQINKQQAVTDLAQVEMALKAQKLAKERQGENATAAYLRSKGLDDAAASAAVANPSVLTNVLGQLNKDPSRVTIGGNIYELKPGDRPSPSNLLGPAKEQESFGLEPDGRGNLWKVNKATNERTIALQGGKPELTEIGVGSGMRQKAFVGPDGNFTLIGEPYQPTAANSITLGAEKAEEKGRGEGLSKRLNDISADGTEASTDLAMAQRATQLLRAADPGAKTAALESFRQATGIAIDPNASNAQAASAAIEYLVPRMRVPGSGTTSDRDMASFRAAMGSLKGTPEGNELAMSTLSSLALHRKQRAEVANAWQLGEISAREAQARMDRLPDPFEGFKTWQSRQSNTSAGAAGQAGTAPRRLRFNPATGAFE